MSSEMRIHHLGNELQEIVDLRSRRQITECEFHAEVAKVAKELALLARTEAGADGVACRINAESLDMLMKGDAHAATVCAPTESGGVPLYTHPQDASGDAEIAVAALREIYETGMYPEGHYAAGEHEFCGSHHATCIGIAERALAAMQAKEAK